MQRHWLDWQRPILPAAAEWLVSRVHGPSAPASSPAGTNLCDLRHVRCVVPGSRAGRLLLRTLIAHCNERGLRLIPPQVMTPGSMVDAVIPPTATTASALECSLAWMHVLREASPQQIAPLLPRQPDYNDWPAWHELALDIGAIAEELAGELTSFNDVGRAALRLGLEREASRWQVLSALSRRYHERLAACERVDPHERRAHALAGQPVDRDDDDRDDDDRDDPSSGDAEAPLVDARCELVLIGVVDLGQLQRQVVAAHGERAHALIHAPAELAAGFDEVGCVDLAYWQDRKISIADERLIICDRPADQAQAVVEQIADFAGRYPPEQITIGLGDEGLAETMAQAGEWADLFLHDPRGRAVHRSRPYRLLHAGVEWLREPRFSTFAALVRHPDVEAWIDRYVDAIRAAALAAQGPTLTEIDASALDQPAANAGSPVPGDRVIEAGGAITAAASARPAEIRDVVRPVPEDSIEADMSEGARPVPEDSIEAVMSEGARSVPKDSSSMIAGAATDADAPSPQPAPEDSLAASGDAAPRDIIADEEGRIPWLTILDKYYANHLSDAASGPWLGDAKNQRRLQLLHEAVHRLFEPLAGDRRPLTEWFEPILAVLRHAFGEIETTTTHLSEARAAAACLEIARALGSFTTAASELQPEVDGTTAVRLVLAQAGGMRVSDDPRSGQIEMLGWLELHLDPAPALVIAGMNDGAIPQSVVADAFLPDSLRELLGVLCNRRRYARDVYLLESIRRSREFCTLVAGRAAADGEPLTPSRLLLAGEREELPGRIIRLCDHERARRWALPRGAPPAGSISRFKVPPPPELPPVRPAMSVTEFGWYLRCPYRYWLKYVQKLRVVEDSGFELDALQFGNITHEVLEHFGLEETIAESQDPLEIAHFLDDALDRSAAAAYGRRPLPAIRIQLARLRERLHAFSIHQARHRAEGWKIERCEYTLPEESWLEVAGQEPMRITGKIDRIDRNLRDGSWMIIDYKTSESGKRPEATHQSTRGSRGGKPGRPWDDLQLPLYHHLAAQHGFDGPCKLAYMNLPKKPEDAAIHVARWTPADLEEAIACAQTIVREVRAGHFEMTDDYPGHFQDDFSNICQTRVFGGDEVGEAEAEA